MVILMKMKPPSTALMGFVTLLLASVFLNSSCTHSNSKSPSLPHSLDAFPSPLPGDKTEGVVHVLHALDVLSRYDQNGRKREAETIGFQLPENEINEYLAYSLRMNPRPGISRAAVKLLPNDEIGALVEIDFDALQKWPSWSIPGVFQKLLSGRRPLRVDAHFHANAGKLTFTLNGAYGPDGSVILDEVMLEMIQALAIHQPEWYDTTRPVPLPFGLQKVWTQMQLVGGET